MNDGWQMVFRVSQLLQDMGHAIKAEIDDFGMQRQQPVQYFITAQLHIVVQVTSISHMRSLHCAIRGVITCTRLRRCALTEALTTLMSRLKACQTRYSCIPDEQTTLEHSASNELLHHKEYEHLTSV